MILLALFFGWLRKTNSTLYGVLDGITTWEYAHHEYFPDLLYPKDAYKYAANRTTDGAGLHVADPLHLDAKMDELVVCLAYARVKKSCSLKHVQLNLSMYVIIVTSPHHPLPDRWLD